MAHVQSTSENSYSATVSHTIALTGVAAGNALLVIVRASTGSDNDMSSVSSSLDGLFTLISDVNNGTIRLKTYILENASSGTHTVTGTAAAVAKTFRWALLEYDAVPPSSVIDDYESAAFTTTTAPATNSVTTTGANRTVVSIVAANLSATTIAPATGETERQEVDQRFQVQDEAAATAGDYSASWTLGATQPGIWAVIALKFRNNLAVKLLAHASAASATGVEGVVLNAARDTVIGEFTGQAFEASLESGEAVLLIPAEDITPDGSTLTTTDTPLVAAYNSTDGTVGLGSATVIEV
jgi:hypothetical protein